MGIYDRDYYREPQPSFSVRGPRTVVGVLILINVLVFLADGLFTPLPPGSPEGASGKIAGTLALKAGDLDRPWMWWQLLTHGFVHASYPEIWHIAGNMLALFFLGPAIEARYGRKEFLRLYLTMIIVAGLVWAVVERLQGNEMATAVGASGAITGIVILFALNFPHQTLLLFFVIPMPAWAAGLLVVAIDIARALQPESTQIAFAAHLAGAAFAFLYHRFRWNLTRLTPSWLSLGRLKSRPKLRVHDPDGRRKEDDLSEQVDRILEKIHREGEASLTKKERRTLESASRKYQKKRRDSDDDPL
ncbi:MAG: rhomboid family intramembrane serine protease [Planctomycetota bacterium]|jgi:membrane associated rhomboid family serine protease